MSRLARCFGLLLVCSALVACNQQTNKNQAQNFGGRGGLKRACAADIQQYCSQQRGRERRDCLQSHISQLSESCKSALASRGGGRMGRRRRDF